MSSCGEAAAMGVAALTGFAPSHGMVFSLHGLPTPQAPLRLPTANTAHQQASNGSRAGRGWWCVRGFVVAFDGWPSFWCSVSIDVLVRARCVDVVFSPAPVLFSYQYVPRWIGLNWGSPSNGICENSDSKQAAFYADFLQQVTSLPISSPPPPPPLRTINSRTATPAKATGCTVVLRCR